jgi:hypothetical protein
LCAFCEGLDDPVGAIGIRHRPVGDFG